MIRVFFAILSVLLCAGAAQAGEFAGADWPSPGGGDSKAHYSTLTQIAPANVKQLGLAWSYDLGTDRVQEATPVVIDGVMITSGNLGRVYALDAASGKALWTFTPTIDMQVNRTVCCDQANRGVAVADGKVFVAALDGMLYALDAKTGHVDWKTDTVVDHGSGYVSTGAPEVAGDLVVIGNAGAEFDVRGYVSAYSRATGKLAWRFYIVPHDPKKGPQESPALTAALKTWDPKSRWDIGGGGAAWDAIVYDRRFDTVYVGTGNGGPYSRAERSPAGRRQSLSVIRGGAGPQDRAAEMVLPGNATGQLGFHRVAADDPDRPHGWRGDPAGHPARAEERIHVRAGSRNRQAAAHQQAGSHELGERLRQIRPRHPDAGAFRLQHRAEDRVSLDGRCAQLVPRRVRSADANSITARFSTWAA